MKIRRKKKLTPAKILKVLTDPESQKLIEEMKYWTVKEATRNGNVTLTIKTEEIPNQ